MARELKMPSYSGHQRKSVMEEVMSDPGQERQGGFDRRVQVETWEQWASLSRQGDSGLRTVFLGKGDFPPFFFFFFPTSHRPEAHRSLVFKAGQLPSLEGCLSPAEHPHRSRGYRLSPTDGYTPSGRTAFRD